ncbi:amino acid ABC transporter substrate-binding protein [Mycolicibacterium wolinskyi]|uniref:ABC transporter substrate-binding protein n=1 Tax=Mycolicibacterium wolinskyi TaxID=59750 RepID=A0A1X2F651_9MYCO|nr:MULTISPECIES: ABC transporter substrate-binding protein [Mycolicibacterium]MCV7284085.1 amino acid ABC transporter substrate-binding protein [Mycolicibacterium wolinskyi]MCV7293921.1 amino acid ABC transporter substrate-binding protein [Mycolicibacterium goodii]ORX13913.1 ABC transporter substrate-binding protein [Mycolicibacterium wolinskyi]
MSTLRVGVVAPDPPFNGMATGPGRAGLDIDLISAIAERLGATIEFVDYTGTDFDGVFDGLGTGTYDCVIAGTTVTPQRQRMAAFAPPYLITGQALAADTNRLPHVRSVADLAGLTIGVQRGDTSQPIAERLVAQRRAARVRVYDYGDIRAALEDLTTGGCDAVMKLAPVLTELVKPLPEVEVVQRRLSTEEIAIAVAPADTELLDRIAAAQGELEADGTLQQIRRRWLGNPFTDQHLAAL